MKCILLAEDEESIRIAYAISLRNADFSVRVVKDGIELLSEMEKRLYDIVISDTDMPRLDGDLACKIILECNEGYRECIGNKGCIIGLSNSINLLENWIGIAHETRYKHGIKDIVKTVKTIYEKFCRGNKKRFKEYVLRSKIRK